MKNINFSHKPHGARFAFLLALLTVQCLRASVTLTDAPATVGNTYSGLITLKISGLNTGETVTVQKFLDLNNNGVVDATDPLVQQFPLTDGQAGMIIDGVSNEVVPGDNDATPGHVTTTINPRAGGLEQTIIGHYLYVVSSPTARFTPVTNSFTITNTSYGQAVSGQVLNNGATIPNALVLLMAPKAGGGYAVQTGVVADGSGHFNFTPPPGNYRLVGASAGFVADIKTAPSITINGGAPIVANITLSPASQTISGSTSDFVIVNQLGGMLITGFSTNGLFAMTFSKAGGDFSLPTTPGVWNVEDDDMDLAFRGYVPWSLATQVDSTAGSVGHVSLQYERTSAMFYGTVFDITGNPLAGITVVAWDSPVHAFSPYSVTDADGNYCLGLMANLGATDLWRIGPGSDASATNLIFYEQDFDQADGTNIVGEQAVQVILIAIPATNEITGTIRDSNGKPISGVGVTGFANVDGEDITLNGVDTDANGNFALNVADGDWTVVVSCGGGGDSLDGILGVGQYACPDPQYVTIADTNATLHFTVELPGSLLLYGYVVDTASNYIAGVDVDFSLAGSGSLIATTDANGEYALYVAWGYWNVSVDCTEVVNLGYVCPLSQTADVEYSKTEADIVLFTCLPLAVGNGDVFLADAGSYCIFPLSNDGCYPPFLWSVPPGSQVAAGMFLDGGQDLVGFPSAVGTNVFTLRVADATGATADGPVTLIVFATPQITNSILPNASVGVPYECQLGASGGYGPLVNWHVIGSDVVPVYMSSSGLLSGTPLIAGTYVFTLGAEDSLGTPMQQEMSLTVYGSLQITTAALPAGYPGLHYAVQLQVAGGRAPYTWSLANNSQNLPPGLTFSATGLLSGTPAANDYGIYSFVAKVTDATSATAINELPLTISSRPTISAPTRQANGSFVFTVNGQYGQNYTIQYSSTLTNWSTLVTTNSATPSFQIADPLNFKLRYYRVLVGP